MKNLRSFVYTGEFRWMEEGRLRLEQKVDVIRHYPEDPLGIGMHVEWVEVKVNGVELVMDSLEDRFDVFG